MKIVLLRHGEPEFRADRLAATQLPKLLAWYNQAPLLAESQPCSSTKALAVSMKQVVCSDLSRSIESAQRLGLNMIHHQGEEFREIALPHSSRFNWPMLKPYSWFLLFRILWLLGYRNNGESIRSGRARAQQCARLLVQRAEEEGSVIFVGHGLLNHYIAKELRRTGWQGPKSPGKAYWSYGLYESVSRR